MGRLIFFVIGIIAVIYLSSTLMFGSSLSESDIEDLFEQRAELHNKLTTETQEMINFIAYTMSTDFTYTSNNTLHTPGQQPRPVSAYMDKKAYGNYLIGTMSQMSQYSYSQDLGEITINENGREATVTYSMTVTATQAGVQDTRITGDCTASLHLSRNDTIRISAIGCKGDMHVTPNTAQPPAPPQ